MSDRILNFKKQGYKFIRTLTYDFPEYFILCTNKFITTKIYNGVPTTTFL